MWSTPADRKKAEKLTPTALKRRTECEAAYVEGYTQAQRDFAEKIGFQFNGWEPFSGLVTQIKSKFRAYWDRVK